MVTRFDRAVDDSDVSDDAAINVIDGIENQRLQTIRRGLRRRDTLDDRFQQFANANARLGRDL